MNNVVLVILTYALIIIVDMIPLFKSIKKKERLLYVSVITVSFIISIILSLNIKTPNPIQFYEKLILKFK